MYALSEVTRARVDVWATSPPSQTAVARDSCASRGQELRLDPQARWPRPPRTPAPEGSDSMCGCGHGPALHRGGGSRCHPHHGAAATPRMGGQGSPNLLSSPAESGTNQTPGWSRPGLGPPPASLPSLPPAGWRRWRRGSQRQALCPDHHAASPAGPSVRSEGSGGCILRGSSCKCLWDVTRDSGGWRQAPCHCSNCPGAGRVSRLSDITHLPEAFPAGPLQPQARPPRPGRSQRWVQPSAPRPAVQRGACSPRRLGARRGRNGERRGAGGAPDSSADTGARPYRGAAGRAFYRASDARVPCPHAGQEEGLSTVLPRRNVSSRTARPPAGHTSAASTFLSPSIRAVDSALYRGRMGLETQRPRARATREPHVFPRAAVCLPTRGSTLVQNRKSTQAYKHGPARSCRPSSRGGAPDAASVPTVGTIASVPHCPDLQPGPQG